MASSLRVVALLLFISSLAAPVWAQRASQADIAATAAEINKFTPVMVDGETELMSAFVRPGTLAYRYRLTTVDVPTAEVDDAAEFIKRELRERVTTATCTGPDTKPIIEAGVAFDYDYYDKGMKFLVTITIGESECREVLR